MTGSQEEHLPEHYDITPEGLAQTAVELLAVALPISGARSQYSSRSPCAPQAIEEPEMSSTGPSFSALTRVQPTPGAARQRGGEVVAFATAYRLLSAGRLGRAGPDGAVASVRTAIDECLAGADAAAGGYRHIEPRESVVLWERSSGRPLGPCVVWQCRRSASLRRPCGAQRQYLLRERTGLDDGPALFGQQDALVAGPHARRPQPGCQR